MGQQTLGQPLPSSSPPSLASLLRSRRPSASATPHRCPSFLAACKGARPLRQVARAQLVGRLWRDLTVDHGFLRSTAVRPDPELPPPDPPPAGSGGQFPLFPALPAARMGHGCCTAGAPPPLHWRRGWLLPSPELHAAFIPSPTRWPLPSLALRTLGLEDPGLVLPATAGRGGAELPGPPTRVAPAQAA